MFFAARSLLSRRVCGGVRGFSSSSPGAMVAMAKRALQEADCVCFDFDSTLITEEGIDVLAAHCGAGEAVAEWTRKAMGGGVPFEVALAARLELIKPSRADVAACLADHAPVPTNGAAEVCHALRERGTKVCVVSGGLRPMIEPTAKAVFGVDVADVFANTLYWNDAGEYTGFEPEEPTSRDGGKARVIAMLKEKHGFQRVVMVGDGATDMQAKPPADATIGFGGVVVRDVVRDNADWFVHDFKDILAVLNESK